MNIDYLYSIVNLYLKKETDTKKTTLSIKKNLEEVEFNFAMNEKSSEKTSFLVSYDVYNNNLNTFLNLYQQELMIIDEKYSSSNNTCNYYVLFKNGRSISFNDFTILEVNNIRNILYNIKINKDEIRVEEIDEEKKMPYEPRLRLQQAGFSSFATLFLVIIFFLDIILITLWVIKSLMN